MVARDPGADIVLTMAVPEGLPSYITKKRIYRSAGTLADSGFYFLDEVDVNETTYTDDKFDSQLVEQMPNFGNPVDGMKDLILCTNGFVAGFRGKDVYFSDPNLPHQWPWKYRMTVGDEIVGMAVRRNTLQVMTVSNLWALIGNYPDEMTAVNMKGGQGCINQRGISNVGNTVIYPSPDGLVGTDSGTPQLVTGTVIAQNRLGKVRCGELDCDRI